MSDLEAAPETAIRADLGPAFVCEVREEGRAAAWVGVRGELDLASAPQFRQAVAQALESALLVVVDLRGLTFMDSTGIHAIVEADARARRDGRRLALIRGPAQIERLFALVGLSNRLVIIDLRPGVVPPGALAGTDPSERA